MRRPLVEECGAQTHKSMQSIGYVVANPAGMLGQNCDTFQANQSDACRTVGLQPQHCPKTTEV